jgi:hypothetical protein
MLATGSGIFMARLLEARVLYETKTTKSGPRQGLKKQLGEGSESSVS